MGKIKVKGRLPNGEIVEFNGEPVEFEGEEVVYIPRASSIGDDKIDLRNS
jgi:hypothetical protein